MNDVEPAPAAAGKYLTFSLGEEEFGLEILKVREILGLMPITRVPRAPPAVRGVINLRGKVIPIIDLRARFEMPARDEDRRTCVIIVEANAVECGVVVDRVVEVARWAAEDIVEPPGFGTGVSTEFLLGMVRTEGRVRMLLDLDLVLSRQELSRAAPDEAAAERDPAGA